MTGQLDFFGEMEPELPGFDPMAYAPAPDKVRAELLRVLAKARAAERMPWDARRTLWRTVFPQMANWLTEEEGSATLRVRDGNPAAGRGLAFFAAPARASPPSD
jgi:hypothetical protein